MLSIRKVIRVIKVIKYPLLITLITLITLSTTFGQANINSPYSRYGIGDLESKGFARNVGMGGIGIGIGTPYNLNFTNPASYSFISLTTFEAGLRTNYTTLKSSGESQTSGSSSFGYFGFAFPLKANKWGLAFGLQPYTNVGYAITDAENLSEVGNVSYNYLGKGGINQFFLGTGAVITKNLRLGVNSSYLFGNIDQVRSLAIPDNVNYFNTRITDETSVGDVHFTFGLQYLLDSLKLTHSDSVVTIQRRIALTKKKVQAMENSLVGYRNVSASADSVRIRAVIATLNDSIATLKKQIADDNTLKSNVVNKKKRGDWSLTLGLTVSLSSDINAKKSSLTETYIKNSFGFTIVKDTALLIKDQQGIISLPLSVGFGVAMKKGTKWVFGADVTTQDWTKFSSFGKTDSLVNSVRFAVGAQYTPDDRSLRSYGKVVQYRFGFHYNQTYLQLRSSQLNEYGASVGFGLPMRKTLSTLQLAFEYGKMGTLSNELVEVSYFRFILGLTLNDVWFIKSRVD